MTDNTRTHASISVSKDVAAMMKIEFESNKAHYLSLGINSPSGLMTASAGAFIDQRVKLRMLAMKITKVPEKISVPVEYLEDEFT